jgi:hypothetical protein
MSEEKKTLVLTGKAYWAHVRKPNEQSGSYQLDLSVDDTTKSMLEGLGITVKNASLGIGVKDKKPGDERGNFVTLKKTAQGEDGTLYPPPQIVDGKKKAVPADVLIGNGSVVNVAAHIYDWKFKSKTGKSLGFSALQIKTLVKYSNPSVDAFKEEDGYVVEDELSKAVEASEESGTFEFDE